jgi:hypothetical protein
VVLLLLLLPLPGCRTTDDRDVFIRDNCLANSLDGGRELLKVKQLAMDVSGAGGDGGGSPAISKNKTSGNAKSPSSSDEDTFLLLLLLLLVLVL